MREILFKAKRLDNGEWVEGYPVYDRADCNLKRQGKCQCAHDGSLITFFGWIDNLHEYDEVEVDPSTVCQYTGQVDYESEEPIFCDDLLKSQNGMEHIYVVGLENGGYFARERGETGIGTPLTIENIGWLMLKRIGSIHDGEGGQHEGNE